MRSTWFIILGCGFVLFFLLASSTLNDVSINLVFGWIKFIWRVLPEIQADWRGLATSFFCLAALIFGCHRFFGWLRSAQKKQSESGVSTPWPWRRTCAILCVVVLMFVAGIGAVGMTHQTVWLISSPDPLFEGGMRRVAGRSMSANNLKQLALGTLVHAQDKKEALPPGVILDREGTPLHGWQTLLLPYIEQDNLYRNINLGRPWNDPVNAEFCKPQVKTYLSPLCDPQEADGFGLSHYAANVHMIGGDNIRFLNSKAVQARGASNTILFGEVSEGFRPWSYPLNWRDPARGLNRGSNSFGNPGRKGTQFGMADGSVMTFADDADPEFLNTISNVAPRQRASPQGIAAAPGW